MSALDVWVVCGGPSGEAEVSRTSARGVKKALEETGHRARLVEFEPKTMAELGRERPDVVFPLTHGTLGEDGCLQGLLEVFDVPYVGSGVLASAIGASKHTAKSLWRAAGVPLAHELVVREGESLIEAASRILRELGPSLVVKPANGGSSIGVRRVVPEDGEAGLLAALKAVLAIDPEALVEPWLSGLEVTCGVLEEGEGIRALPPTLLLPERGDFYDFASKYAPGGSRHVCPAPLPQPVIARIQQLAVLTHRTIGARDLSRTDFIVDESRGAEHGLAVLEINTLPGMTAVSLFPEAAEKAGIAFKYLVDGLVRRAISRPRRRTVEVFAMPT